MFFLLTLFASLSLSAAESTNFAKIDQVLVSGSSDIISFKTASGGWGASNCKTASTVYIYTSRIQNKEAFLSVALAAKIHGKTVSFVGECDTANASFNATDIILQ